MRASEEDLPLLNIQSSHNPRTVQRYTYTVLQTIQMILLCVWAEWAVLGSGKTALRFKYEILIG